MIDCRKTLSALFRIAEVESKVKLSGEHQFCVANNENLILGDRQMFVVKRLIGTAVCNKACTVV